jgi:citrate lyase subunit beta / citryl-CoA lyase
LQYPHVPYQQFAQSIFRSQGFSKHGFTYFSQEARNGSMTIKPRRSVLYMPGANGRALEKAKTIAADSLILDLEDSVSPDAKGTARTGVAQVMKAGGYGNRELVIRINGLDTPWGMDDLKMAVEANPHAVLVPKIKTPNEVVHAQELMTGFKGQLWVMVENPLSVFNIQSIAAACETTSLSCLVMGTNDLVKETRATAARGRFALLPWLSMTVLAARAYGLDVIDGVYNDFKNEAGFRTECEQGRDLGMDGKTLIHPSQVAVCNEVFSPVAEEIAWSQRVIENFSLPENASKGVITIDGRMVERLHLAMAERVVTIAGAIAHA